MPAGAWQLASAVRPFVLRETFEAGQVQRGKLVLNERRGSIQLQLYFQPREIPPGESIVLSTTWQFLIGEPE
jgi:hypothetical protein